MRQRGTTINQAAHEWVNEFNAIPQAIVEKLMKADYDEVNEITPPSRGDHVYILDEEHNGEYGMIVGTRYDDEDDLYEVHLDGAKDDDNLILAEDEFEVERDGGLPMWGTMWAFGDGCDNYWLQEEDGLQKMADCGFRIYEQEDYEYIFGIDGAGYDFYEAHWIPLYKARGLMWHDKDGEVEA